MTIAERDALVDAAFDVRNFEYMTAMFVGLSDSGKTRRYVVNGSHGGLLGRVRWFGRWRQYAFFPEPGCVFSAGCLRDVASFLDDLKAERSS